MIRLFAWPEAGSAEKMLPGRENFFRELSAHAGLPASNAYEIPNRQDSFRRDPSIIRRETETTPCM